MRPATGRPCTVRAVSLQELLKRSFCHPTLLVLRLALMAFSRTLQSTLAILATHDVRYAISTQLIAKSVHLLEYMSLFYSRLAQLVLQLVLWDISQIMLLIYVIYVI